MNCTSTINQFLRGGHCTKYVCMYNTRTFDRVLFSIVNINEIYRLSVMLLYNIYTMLMQALANKELIIAIIVC